MQDRMLQQLKEDAAAWGIPVSGRALAQFSLYYELLLEWNTRVNLTRITEPAAVCRQHFLDSIAPMRWVDLTDRSLIDIGTGAGFPGIPLKIMNPSMRLTLLDALDKRCRFLREVVARLGLDDGISLTAAAGEAFSEADAASSERGVSSVTILHGRAEDFAASCEKKQTRSARGSLPAADEDAVSLRGQFDFAASRAVARLNILCEYAVPFLKTGGQFIAYKLDDDAELDEARAPGRALDLLHASLARRESYMLPATEPGRALFFIARDGDTPEKYPRRAGMPEKRPL